MSPAYNGEVQNLRQVTQLVAAGVVIVAGVPLALNEFSALHQRGLAGDRAVEFARIGTDAAAARDFQLAIRAATEACRAAPDRADFRRSLTQYTAKSILSDPAASDSRVALRQQIILEEALGRRDADEEVQLALGRIYLLRGQTEASRRTFEQVVQANPKSGRALMYLGDLQLKTGELDNALATLKRAVAADDSLTEAKFALGQAHLARKDHESALPWLETAARELPRSGQASLALGRALAATSKWPEAQKALERALALDSTLVQAHAPLGDAYVAARMLEPAVGSYRLAWEKAHDLDAYRKLGRIYLQVGAADGASAVFSQIRDLAPSDPEPHLVLGLLANATKQPELARRSWERCIELAAASEQWQGVGAKCQEFMKAKGGGPVESGKAPRRPAP